jgi:glutathione peroxidase-family protein
MQRNCRESCYKKTYREPEHRLVSDEEFYDLTARDANGKVLSMENLEGYVTVIVNAARVCGE